jgi:hypothetical protein
METTKKTINDLEEVLSRSEKLLARVQANLPMSQKYDSMAQSISVMRGDIRDTRLSLITSMAKHIEQCEMLIDEMELRLKLQKIDAVFQDEPDCQTTIDRLVKKFGFSYVLDQILKHRPEFTNEEVERVITFAPESTAKQYNVAASGMCKQKPKENTAKTYACGKKYKPVIKICKNCGKEWTGLGKNYCPECRGKVCASCGKPHINKTGNNPYCNDCWREKKSMSAAKKKQAANLNSRIAEVSKTTKKSVVEKFSEPGTGNLRPGNHLFTGKS